MDSNAILAVIGRTIADALKLDGFQAQRDTAFLDIEGWDSLSCTLVILSLEKELQVKLPLNRLFGLDSLGQLADLIHEVLPAA
jgi:acyl carrier protein